MKNQTKQQIEHLNLGLLDPRPWSVSDCLEKLETKVNEIIDCLNEEPTKPTECMCNKYAYSHKVSDDHSLKTIPKQTDLETYKAELVAKLEKEKAKFKHDDHSDKDEWYACVKCMEDQSAAIDRAIELVRKT